MKSCYRHLILFAITFSLLGCLSPDSEFEKSLLCVSTAWNANDARTASECFAEDALYTEGGQKQHYSGRAELFHFFGGESGRTSPMSMTWHGWAFNPVTQTGYAEFSFEYGSFAHGVAIIQLEDELIKTWREYWYESEADWSTFIAPYEP